MHEVILSDEQFTTLTLIRDVCERRSLNFLVIGATARDIICEQIHKLRIHRATRDLDLALMVEDWDGFNAVREDLIKTKKFRPARQLHQLKHQHLEIDLVPFGHLEDPNGCIVWPDSKAVMNVTGFLDCLTHAIAVRSRQSLQFKVPNLACLFALKLIAWNDRPNERDKDILDIAYIMTTYADTGNDRRIYEDHIDLIEAEPFDLGIAAATLLGRDIKRDLSKPALQQVHKILNRELASDSPNALIERIPDTKMYDRYLALLQAVRAGL